jgi:U2 small nuclear ribonucleoprotein B''
MRSIAEIYALQKIAYAKGKSDTIAKLDGTYRMPTVAGTAVATTELQQSIFNAPPSSVTADAGPPGLPNPPPTSTNGVRETESATLSNQGVKRPREEESDEEDAPMEEDDSDAPMEASSDEE